VNVSAPPKTTPALRAAIDWSYELLEASEQRLFRSLAVFPGGFTLKGRKGPRDGAIVLDVDYLENRQLEE
jgi:predicted ATPase